MQTELIRYEIDGIECEGALVHDGAGAMRPLVLVAPNWMGMTEAAVERGKLIAGDRYTVFVVDMYGVGRRPADPSEAAKLSGAIKADAALARRRMRAALDVATSTARARGITDGRLRAAVGFCFGGGNVLELARAGADVHAVVSVHGDLVTSAPVEPGVLKAAVLAIHGAADPIAPLAHRLALEKEMEAAGAKWQLLIFGGLVHAFTEAVDVPGVAKYDEPATRQTYALMHAFIADAFRNTFR